MAGKNHQKICSSFLDELFNEMRRKAKNAKADKSYTAYLVSLGEEAIGKKLIEEAFELAIANMNFKSNARQETILEAADLLYHIMVVLVSKDINFSEVIAEMQNRAQQRATDQNAVTKAIAKNSKKLNSKKHLS